MSKKSSSDNHAASSQLLKSLSLGQSVEYKQEYDPNLLQSVPRSLNRKPLGIDANDLPFSGVDQWTGYELSWLNLKGKPQFKFMQLI